MEPKLLLVKAITLVYRESQYKEKLEDSLIGVVKEIMHAVKIPEHYLDGGSAKETLSGLKATLQWMITRPVEFKFDKVEILQRLRVDCSEDDSLYEAVSDGIVADLNQDELQRTVNNHRNDLRDYINHQKVSEILKQASIKANFQTQTIDWKHFVKDIVAELAPYQNTEAYSVHPAMVTEFDFANLDKVESQLQQAVDELSPEGALRCGLQGVNRMLGPLGRFRRGEFVLIGGLQHKFKSGFLNTIMRGIAMHNVPTLRDPTKKPMILHISFENKGSDNVLWLYKSIMEAETGIYVDENKIDPVKASVYVKEKMESTGFHLYMCQMDPTMMTYRDIYTKIEELESQGYEIVVMFLDYLNKVSKKGCEPGPFGYEIRDLVRKVRNFTMKKGITTFNAHQLSTEAKDLYRQNIKDFLKEIAGKGYYDGCKGLDQEPDLEIHVHIEEVNGEFYLTLQRGKHRGLHRTPLEDQSICYKFEKIGTILDDVNGRDMSIKKPGMSPGSSEAPWWGVN